MPYSPGCGARCDSPDILAENTRHLRHPHLCNQHKLGGTGVCRPTSCCDSQDTLSWKHRRLWAHQLLHVQVVDDRGQEHEVLLRSFIHGQETLYLLDRLADLLHSVNAQAGDMLMLTRDETGPVVGPRTPPAYVTCQAVILTRGETGPVVGLCTSSSQEAPLAKQLLVCDCCRKCGVSFDYNAEGTLLSCLCHPTPMATILAAI